MDTQRLHPRVCVCVCLRRYYFESFTVHYKRGEWQNDIKGAAHKRAAFDKFYIASFPKPHDTCDPKRFKLLWDKLNEVDRKYFHPGHWIISYEARQTGQAPSPSPGWIVLNSLLDTWERQRFWFLPVWVASTFSAPDGPANIYLLKSTASILGKIKQMVVKQGIVWTGGATVLYMCLNCWKRNSGWTLTFSKRQRVLYYVYFYNLQVMQSRNFIESNLHQLRV